MELSVLPEKVSVVLSVRVPQSAFVPVFAGLKLTPASEAHLTGPHVSGALVPPEITTEIGIDMVNAPQGPDAQKALGSKLQWPAFPAFETFITSGLATNVLVNRETRASIMNACREVFIYIPPSS